MTKRLNLTGKKFGKLIAVSIQPIINGQTRWLCQCKCGKQTIASTKNLMRGGVKSCGCFKIECNLTHGLSKSKFYSTWNNMKRRCRDKSNKSFNTYGDRGIKVCDRWLNPINFKEDMYKSYLEHTQQFGEVNTTIDRINNNENYEPNNCKWSTQKEQANNKSNNHFLTFDGQTLTMAQWAEKMNINLGSIHSRINAYKWSTEKALTTPIKQTNRWPLAKVLKIKPKTS